jgi:hypothetical protein
MGFSFFPAAGLKITSLPLAPDRPQGTKAVATSLVTQFVTNRPQLIRRERKDMKQREHRTVMIAVLIILAAIAHTLHASEPDLSAAETTAVNRRIATLKAPGDRKMAQGWSNTKKVAELLCRPAALPVLKKQATGVDRVFLGTDDPKR